MMQQSNAMRWGMLTLGIGAITFFFAQINLGPTIFLPSIFNNESTIPEPEPNATAPSTPLPTDSPTNTPTPTPTTEIAWVDTWLVNAADETSAEFSGVEINIDSVSQQTIDGADYQCIVASGIPGYQLQFSQEMLDSLTSRPKFDTDFPNGVTASVNDSVLFGQDIGFNSTGCSVDDDGYGYWPPGPVCPTDQQKEQCFPLDPQPATTACETGLSSIGTWVNGVSMYNWEDGFSYENEGVWENVASEFELYDVDICAGHAAGGDYHHHFSSICLMEQMDEDGAGHSEIYGFAADGYPVYGPWHDTDVLAQSCWKTRDYDDPASPTGCGVAGERSCLLVDQLDSSQGVTPASANGPTTSESVLSLSRNTFVTTSGFYFQDYYYDSACTAQGEEYLDEHNGHDHDGLGYHYHVTMGETGDGDYTSVFPYYVGPTFAGELMDNAITQCGGRGPGGGGPGGSIGILGDRVPAGMPDSATPSGAASDGTAPDNAAAGNPAPGRNAPPAGRNQPPPQTP